MRAIVVCALLASIACVTLVGARFNANTQLADVPPVCHSVPPALWCSCKTLAETCGHTTDCSKYAHYSYNEPLHLTVLYESLCPDSQLFIIEELYNALYTTPLRELVTIELVPFGNARQLSNGTIVCQHGEKECAINKFQSCALHYLSEPIPFITCVERKLTGGEDIEIASRECYEKQHTIPHIYDQISHCVNGALGDQLQAAAAKRTAAAWPDAHTHVPWVLFNNVSVAGQQFLMNDLPMTVCQLYTGAKHAEHCAGIGALRRVAHRRVGCPRKYF